jgi:hypothetical protein
MSMKENSMMVAAGRAKWFRFRQWIVRNIASQKRDDEQARAELRLLLDDIAAEGHVDPKGKWGLSEQGHFILREAITNRINRVQAMKERREMNDDSEGWPDDNGSPEDGFEAVDR